MTEITPDAREFAAVLMQHRKGVQHDKATELLTRAIDATRHLGQKSEVTVKLVVSPVKNNADMVRIEAHIAGKIPEEIQASMWYTDTEGGLYRNDPTQGALWEDDNKTRSAGKDT